MRRLLVPTAMLSLCIGGQTGSLMASDRVSLTLSGSLAYNVCMKKSAKRRRDSVQCSKHLPTSIMSSCLNAYSRLSVIFMLPRSQLKRMSLVRMT